MTRSDILKALDTEIHRLQEARTLLAESPETFFASEPARRGPGRPKGAGSGSGAKTSKPAAKRVMSAEGRARIAAAQKQRWAKLHKTQATASKPAKKQPSKLAKSAATAKKAFKKPAVKKTVVKKTAAKKTEAKPVTS